MKFLDAIRAAKRLKKELIAEIDDHNDCEAKDLIDD